MSIRPAQRSLPTIEIARLGVAAEPVVHNSDAKTRGERWRGAALTSTHRYVDLELLVGDSPTIAAESLTFVVAETLHAPVLQSYLVHIVHEHLLESRFWLPGERERLGFGVESSALRTTATFDPIFLTGWHGLAPMCVTDAILGIVRSLRSGFAYDGRALYLVDHGSAQCVRNRTQFPDDQPSLRLRSPLLEELAALWNPGQRRAFANALRKTCATLHEIDFNACVRAARLPEQLGEIESHLISEYLGRRASLAYEIVCGQCGIAGLKLVR